MTVSITFFRSARYLGALTLVAALAACGGSGDGSSDTTPPPTTNPDVTVDRSTTALNASAQTSTYTGGTLTNGMFDAINTIRVAAGLGAFRQSAALDTAAQAQAAYIMANSDWYLNPHVQTAGRTGFYAATLGERAALAGYTGSGVSESIGGTGGEGARGCVEGLLNTVYHANDLQAPWHDVGIAEWTDLAGIPACVIVYGKTTTYGQLPDAGVVKAYPYDTQTGVEHTFYSAAETPRPMPNVAGPLGTPVFASVVTHNWAVETANSRLTVRLNSFTLKDGSGNLVPAYLIGAQATNVTSDVTLDTTSPAGNLRAGDFYLVPQSPLVSGQTYTAEFRATVSGESAQLVKTWSFTTK